MTEPSRPVTPRRASNTAYVIVTILMLALAIFFFSKGAEPIGRRELPGWALGCLGVATAGGCLYILWRRRRGEPSRLEDI